MAFQFLDIGFSNLVWLFSEVMVLWQPWCLLLHSINCLTVSHNQQAAFMAVFLEILNNLLVLSKPMNTSVKTDKAIPFLQCDFS